MSIAGSGHNRANKPMGNRTSKTHGGSDMAKPSPKEVKAMADVAGVPATAEVAERIANSIGPAFDGFAPVAGTLPFDLEPASFLLVQNAKVST
jgi:hypothetical protein